MTATDLLRILVDRLEGAGIRYALCGSIASMVYGEPRSTLDIDVVVALEPAQGAIVADLFPAPDFYLDRRRVDEVARAGGTFNVVHPASGLKMDFFVVSDAIEERQIRGRVRRALLTDLRAYFSPPEELILKKLEYFRAGGSEKHLRDIRSMLEISPDAIDLPKLLELVERFGLSDEWRRIDTESGPRTA